MIWLIIYIAGAIAAFTWVVVVMRRTQDICLTDLCLIAFVSLMSWVFVVIWAYMFLREACYENDFVVFKKKKDNNENNNN